MWFLLAHGALAQDVPAFNVQLFRPSVDAGNMLWTDDAARARNRQLTGRASTANAGFFAATAVLQRYRRWWAARRA